MRATCNYKPALKIIILENFAMRRPKFSGLCFMKAGD